MKLWKNDIIYAPLLIKIEKYQNFAKLLPQKDALFGSTYVCEFSRMKNVKSKTRSSLIDELLTGILRIRKSKILENIEKVSKQKMSSIPLILKFVWTYFDLCEKIFDLTREIK